MIEQNIIVKYVPNFVTLLSLSSGFTSISFSLNKEWEIAIYLILLATVFDFFSKSSNLSVFFFFEKTFEHEAFCC